MLLLSRLSSFWLRSLDTGNLIELRLCDHAAVAVESGTELDRKSSDIEVSVH